MCEMVRECELFRKCVVLSYLRMEILKDVSAALDRYEIKGYEQWVNIVSNSSK